MKVIDLYLWNLENIGYYDIATIGWVIAEAQKEDNSFSKIVTEKQKDNSFLQYDIVICTEMRNPLIVKIGNLVHIFPDDNRVLLGTEKPFIYEEYPGLISNKMIYEGYRAITRKKMITYLKHSRNESEAERLLLESFLLGPGRQMVTFRTEDESLGAYMGSDEVVIASRIEPYSRVLKDSMKLYQEEMNRMRREVLAQLKI